ncbi:hypothetical protein N7527_001337 [Penicillium freii]|nr:hypothetical protein N7527_001337 [Penicillium freii]
MLLLLLDPILSEYRRRFSRLDPRLGTGRDTILSREVVAIPTSLLPTREQSKEIYIRTFRARLYRYPICRSSRRTGLIWKVAYYGLPAIGIMLLAILKQYILRAYRTQSLQDLSVFVAEV